MSRQAIIGVIGAGSCDTAIETLAYRVGSGIAAQGGVLLCCGQGGVMQAACKGASEAGGMTIGLLPGTDKRSANPYVTIALPTGLNDARNVIIARSSDVLIAVGGQFGTLSEIAFGLKFGVSVIGLETWDVSQEILRATTPDEAVSLAFAQLQ